MLLRMNSWLRPVRSLACFCCLPQGGSDSQGGQAANAWRVAAVFSFVVSLAVGGCAGTDPTLGKVVLVSGRVLVNGEPLQGKKGIVIFVPDETKGNVAPVQPTGDLDESGNYTLYYAKSKKGAPLGWYKVQVSAAKLGPGIKMGPELKDPKKMTGAPFNAKFTNVKTSGLEVEVVESPAAGAYDLKLTK